MVNEVVKLIENEFREMLDPNDISKFDLKVRNIRFIGELTKFSLVSP